jgi:hypothetical protein
MAEKNKRYRWRILLGVMVVIALILGVCGYGYSTYDWFKSSKQLYLEKEASALTALAKSYLENQDEVLQKIANPAAKTVYSQQKVTVSLADQYAEDPVGQMLLQALGKSSLTVETAVDNQKKAQYTKTNLVINGASPLTLEFIGQNGKAVYGIPTLSPKYAVLNSQDRDKNKANETVRLPQQISVAELTDAVKLSEAEIAPIIKDYAKIYADAIDKNDVTIEQGVFIEGDTRIQGTQYTVQMDQAKYEKFLNQILDQLAADQRTQDLIYSKYSKIAGIYQDAGMDIKILSQEDFAQKLQLEIQTIKNNQKAYPIKGIKMVVQTNPAGQIIERRFSTLENLDYTARLAAWQTDGQHHLALAYSDIRNNATQEYKINYTDQSLTADFDLRPGQWDKIKGDITYNQKKQDNGRTDYDMKINVNADTEELYAGLTVGIQGYHQDNVPVTIPAIDQHNAVDLRNDSPQAVQSFYQDLQKGLGNYIMKNPSLIQLFGELSDAKVAI